MFFFVAAEKAEDNFKYNIKQKVCIVKSKRKHCNNSEYKKEGLWYNKSNKMAEKYIL